jgi:integrase
MSNPPKSPTMETVEPGIYRRRDPRSGKMLPTLWIHYPKPGGGTDRESADTTSIVLARKKRAKRMEEAGRGEPGRAADKVRTGALLDALVVDYETNGRGSTPTLKSHVAVLRTAVGHLRAVDVTTDRVQRLQRAWQDAGLTNASINRRCSALRRAFVLAVRARHLHHVPYVPRLEERSPRTRAISPTEADALEATTLPAYLRDLFRFVYEHGTRKGQLCRTLRRFVDLDGAVITWPPSECKANEAHVIPLEGVGLAIIERLMARPPLHCPYLFHGPDCAPGHTPSKRYGCVGDFKKAWTTACRKANLPIGRKAAGVVFHSTRVSAATNLRAGGTDEADAMKITGHQTSHLFKRYDLGDTDALRQRLTRARQHAATLHRLRGNQQQRVAHGRSADDCTATTQQPLAPANPAR